jgi:hypothetical protein
MLPVIHRALLDRVEQTMREFMVEFVEMYWQQLTSPRRKGDLAHLLSRRLALSLDAGGEALAEQLADQPGVDLERDSVHPMRYYIFPCIGGSDCWTTGDLIRGPDVAAIKVEVEKEAQDGGRRPLEQPEESPPQDAVPPNNNWYVVLTPACDLVPDRIKAEYVVLVECIPLAQIKVFRAWKECGDAGKPVPKVIEDELRELMRNNAAPKDRRTFLPGVWEAPDLVIDFQRIVHLPYSARSRYRRIMTLDSPYAQALIEKFGRYLGRVGTPDLDIRVSMDRLRDSKEASK